MSEETELIKERLDLAALIQEYVPLKHAGQHLKGLCPFHQEKTPSFVVSPTRGMWHCFGCSEGGDAFAFIQKIEGLDFVGALKLLAERTGVELKPFGSAQGKQVQNERQRLFDLLQLTARFYHEVLMHHAAGKKAQAYLQERGVTEATMEQFQIGYAPTGWDTLQQFLRKKNFGLPEMMAAGVVGMSGVRAFDRFRGRIIFPVTDLQGRVIAFGGRITPWTETGREGKYVNSPETKLYSKRRTVYNLQRAKQHVRHGAPMVVVEGYMDVVMMTQAGWPGVVASSGTAFTAEQVEQLKRFTDTLHFAFDADAAGWKAAQAATSAALGAGMRVATVQFPTGQDPADVAKAQPQELKNYLAQPQSLVTVALRHLKSGASVDQRLQEVLPLVAAVSHPVQQGEMIQEVARVLHLSEERVIQLVARAAVDRPSVAPVAPEGAQEGVRLSAEQWLLGLVLLEAAVRREVLPKLSPGWFVDDGATALYKQLQYLSNNQDFFTMTSEALMQLLPSELLPLAEGMRVVAADRLAFSSEVAVTEARGLAQWIQRRWLERRLQTLQTGLATMTTPERGTLLQEFQAVAEELERVKAPLRGGASI